MDISPALDPATAGGAFCGEAHSTRIQPQLDLSPALDPATAGGAVCGEAHSTRIQPQVDISPALELATAGDAVCGADQCSTVLQPQTLQMKTPIQVTQVESLRSWSLPDLLGKFDTSTAVISAWERGSGGRGGSASNSSNQVKSEDFNHPSQGYSTNH